MKDPMHNIRTERILEQLGQINPYNRMHDNRKSEYYIYQMGFLASFLASLMEEDSLVYTRFKHHIEEQRKRQQGK